MGLFDRVKEEAKPIEIFRMEVVDKAIIASEYGEPRFAILFVHEKNRAKTFTYSSARFNNVTVVYANVRIGETYDFKFNRGDAKIIAINGFVVG